MEAKSIILNKNQTSYNQFKTFRINLVVSEVEPKYENRLLQNENVTVLDTNIPRTLVDTYTYPRSIIINYEKQTTFI